MEKPLHEWVFPINALPARQLVHRGIDDISFDADTKCEAVLNYYDRVDSDLLFFFSDIVIQAEAMGAVASYSADAMPSIKRPAQNIDDRKRASTIPRMRINSRVIQRMAGAFPHQSIAAIVIGPLTVAGQLIGEKTLLKGILERPDSILELLAGITRCAEDYGQYLLDSGADVLWISDPLASLLPPESFWRFAGESVHRLFAACPAGHRFLHICGDTTRIIGPMIETGATGLSLDQCMNLLVTEDLFPESIQIIGNVDPELVETGSSHEVEETVRDLTGLLGMKENFTLSTGCGLPPATPLDNIITFVESGRSHLAEVALHAGLLDELGRTTHEGRWKDVPHLVHRALDEGADPLRVIQSALMRAVRKGSGRYESKRCYLPEMLMISEAFYEGFKVLEPHMGVRMDTSPEVALGTVRGDFHEIGKDLVRIMLESNGIRVLDLGVDVDPGAFLDAVKSQGIPVVCLSAFISSAKKRLEETVKRFKNPGFEKVAVFIGGAAASQQMAHTIGADGYGRDAVEAVHLVKKSLKTPRDKYAP